jgi:outer membrane protein
LKGIAEMRVFLVAVAMSVTLAAAPSFAQAPATQTPTPKPSTPPAAPRPTPAPGTQAPATPAPTPQAAPQPPRPFPEGSKIAYVNVQRVASDSEDGKASTAKLSALQQKKSTELNEKTKAVTAAEQKLQQGGSLLNDAARSQLEKDVERYKVELQRMQQDAQAEMTDMQQELQAEFQRKLLPIIQQVVAEKGVQILFSVGDSGILWADTGLDLSAEVIRRLDGLTPSSSATPKPPAKPPVQ